MEDDVYKRITQDLEFIMLHNVKTDIDESILTLQSHQIFPDIYFTSFPEKRVLLLDYEMGTGKTLSAAYVLANLAKRLFEYRQIKLEAVTRITFPRIFIIGSWATIGIFQKELLRPELGIITANEANALKTTNEEQLKRLKNQIFRRISPVITMYTYQKFFNRLLQHSAATNITSINDISNPNPILIESLNNSIICVDEMQNLYSMKGANTYAMAIEYIMQAKNIRNLKLIGLSGTFLGRSLVELVVLANIVRDKGTPRLEFNDYLRQRAILGSRFIWDYKKDKIDELIAVFDTKVASYMPARDQSKYPDLIEMGEIIATKDIKFRSVKIVRCAAHETQWKAYLAEVSKESGPIDEEDDDEENQLMKLCEFYVPPREQWEKLGIDMQHERIIQGNILVYPKLKEYSTMAAKFLETIFDVFKRGAGEKIAGYHRRLRHLGILQYEEILQANGIIRYYDNALPNTLCIKCGKRAESHDRKATHPFVAARFASLTGKLGDARREEVVKKYNAPDNVYGDKIAIILLSAVAEFGIMLMNTNHVFALGIIPSFSKKQQLEKRFVRIGSHAMTDKKWTKFYLLAFSSPDLKQITEYELRYFAKEQSHLLITDTWQRIRRRAVTCQLYGNDCRYQYEFAKNPNRTKYNIFYSHIEVESVIKIIRFYLANISPIVAINTIRAYILDDEAHKTPWSTRFIADESIAAGIFRLLERGEIVLYSSAEEITLSKDSIKKPDVSIAVAPTQQNRAHLFDIFIDDRDSSIISIPLTRAVAVPLMQLIDEFAEIHGNRNKYAAFDKMLIYDDFIESLKKDFDDRGKLFEFLISIDAIIYEGDDKDRVTFAKNRLSTQRVKEIGFILGPFAFVKENKTWTQRAIPYNKVQEEDEFTYCAVFSGGTQLEHGKWMVRFRIRKHGSGENKELQYGIACKSANSKMLKDVYFKLFHENPSLSKKSKLCEELRQKFLEETVKSPKKRYIYTYYEIS